MKNRLLFFDILRIFAVFSIVASHAGFILLSISIPGIYSATLGGLGVTILLFVSGAVLMYNYQTKYSRFNDVLEFYAKRLSRIYPAYWISLILGLLMVPTLLYLPFSDIALQFSGFMAFTNQWGGTINSIGWFIGLLVVLYLLFPVLEICFQKHPHISIFFLFVISNVSRLYFFNVGNRMSDWFPLCRLFEFGIGIYIIKIGFYPKWITQSDIIIFLSEISFYLFLTHVLIFKLGSINLIFSLIALILLSIMLWITDEKIQVFFSPFIKAIKNNNFAEIIH